MFLTPFQPSHIERLTCSFFDFNPNIDILRDDLIHPVVSGNKWRKLKYVIQELKKLEDPVLVTFGGAYSNHLVATAYAANYFHIKAHGFVRGDEARELNLYERICLDNHMTLQHVSRTDYRDKLKLFHDFRLLNPGAVFLNEGGDHELALKGCGEILDEPGNTYDYIVLAAGTGTTVQGLVKGVIERGMDTKVIGISALKGNKELDRRLAKYPQNFWQIEHHYHRGRYASMDGELLGFIKDFFVETGIRLDPVYTGKMMLAAIDLYRKEFFRHDDRVLLIHTGGLLAFPEE